MASRVLSSAPIGSHASHLLASTQIPASQTQQKSNERFSVTACGVVHTPMQEQFSVKYQGEWHVDSRAMIKADMGALCNQGEWSKASSLTHSQTWKKSIPPAADKLAKPTKTRKKQPKKKQEDGNEDESHSHSHSHSAPKSDAKDAPEPDGVGKGRPGKEHEPRSPSVACTAQMQQQQGRPVKPMITFNRHFQSNSKLYDGHVQIGHVAFPMGMKNDIESMLDSVNVDWTMKMYPRRLPIFLGSWQESAIWNIAVNLHPQRVTAKFKHRGAGYPTALAPLKTEHWRVQCFYGINASINQPVRKPDTLRKDADDSKDEPKGSVRQLYELAKGVYFSEKETADLLEVRSFSDVFQGDPSNSWQLSFGAIAKPRRSLNSNKSSRKQTSNETSEKHPPRLVEGSVQLEGSDPRTKSVSLHTALYSSMLAPLTLAFSNRLRIRTNDPSSITPATLLESVESSLAMWYQLSDSMWSSVRTNLHDHSTEVCAAKKFTLSHTAKRPSTESYQRRFWNINVIKQDDHQSLRGISSDLFLRAHESYYTPPASNLINLCGGDESPTEDLPDRVSRVVARLPERHNKTLDPLYSLKHLSNQSSRTPKATATISTGLKSKLNPRSVHIERGFLAVGLSGR